MGVVTRADEKLKSAEANINQGYKDLLEVLNPDTWGNSDYNEQFLTKIHECVADLLKIKQKLKF